jgi:hypothetical protein
MPERLSLGIIPGAGWRASEIRTIACEAEDAGCGDISLTPIAYFAGLTLPETAAGR